MTALSKRHSKSVPLFQTSASDEGGSAHSGLVFWGQFNIVERLDYKRAVEGAGSKAEGNPHFDGSERGRP